MKRRIIILFLIYPLSILSETITEVDSSDHFIFYAVNKNDDVIQIRKRLEENYGRITKFYNVTIENKIIVEIYPDIKEFHAAIGWPDVSDGIVGTSLNGRKIMMVTPGNPGTVHTYENMLCVAVHEFTHFATYTLNPELSHYP